MHSKIFQILFYISFFVSCYSQGQDNVSIHGFVKSEINDKPIPYGRVRIGQLGLWTFVNSAGWYKLENVPPGKYTVSFISEGFITKDTSISVDGPHDLKLDLAMTSKSPVNAALAERDIQLNTPRLLHITGIVSASYSFRDHRFEKEYGVKYYSYGCVSPPEHCLIEYNRIIFGYLDNKFGTRWRNYVREDIIGLKK
ncbi:MAG: carboxypeptidase regulatory-like domain-containing protein [Ignavibacteriae bacterium]|nr:carboxypeptidase regulatory-like domain-containing protein [Ignavibacteriota bacterium]